MRPCYSGSETPFGRMVTSRSFANGVSGRTASIRNFPIQDVQQSFNTLGLFRNQVLLFSAILLQIEQLHRRKILFLGLGLSRSTPAAAAAGKAQFPVFLTNRERTADGVTDQCHSIRVRIRFEGRDETEGVFATLMWTDLRWRARLPKDTWRQWADEATRRQREQIDVRFADDAPPVGELARTPRTALRRRVSRAIRKPTRTRTARDPRRSPEPRVRMSYPTTEWPRRPC